MTSVEYNQEKTEKNKRENECPAALQADGLTYSWPDGTKALDGISFEVQTGEKLAVLGANGSGKSTLFLCLNGILTPQGGEVKHFGRAFGYSKKEKRELSASVGIVFQDPETALFCVTVYEEIAFGPFNMGKRGEVLSDSVEEMMRNSGLEELKDRHPSHLSTGQKKRVSIASVLAMNPSVVIFDEPMSSLDPAQREDTLTAIDALSLRGITVLLSTHDMDMAYAWADRVAVLAAGKLVSVGTPSEVFADSEMLQAAGLRQPITLSVWRQLADAGVVKSEDASRPPKTMLEFSERLRQIKKPAVNP